MKRLSMSSRVRPKYSQQSDKSICKRQDRPLVSGMKNNAQKLMITMRAPKNIYVPYPRDVIMYGVVREIRKLQNH